MKIVRHAVNHFELSGCNLVWEAGAVFSCLLENLSPFWGKTASSGKEYDERASYLAAPPVQEGSRRADGDPYNIDHDNDDRDRALRFSRWPARGQKADRSRESSPLATVYPTLATTTSAAVERSRPLHRIIIKADLPTAATGSIISRLI